MIRLVLLFSIFFAFLLSKTDTVLAQATPTPVDYNLPYPGLLPDHPLYPLKRIRDFMILTFTRDRVKKVNVLLLLSDKKLAMGQILFEKQNYHLGVKTITEGEKYLLPAADNLSRLKTDDTLPPGLADKLLLAAEKHQELISKLSSTLSDNQYLTILNEGLSYNHQATTQIQSVK